MVINQLEQLVEIIILSLRGLRFSMVEAKR
jgi:hypothetical protein